MTPDLPMRVSARVIRGKGRGKWLGYPTLNLTIPAGFPLAHGIYACRVFVGDELHAGALHFGPIPVFDEPALSFEVHLLDMTLADAPAAVDVEIVRYLRAVQSFPSSAALAEQIARDVDATRRALAAYDESRR
ncbi:MAG: hypothetical protein FJX78_03535 [Armatimonadetes bacterium]|nr:hypothetical protein [Armatimonadota bacterium]